MFRLTLLIILAILLTSWSNVKGKGKFEWMAYDHFDAIDDKIRAVTAENCHAKSREDLLLRPDTVAQRPVFNQLLSRVWYRNRTSLIHIHNMALNRAFFYSYVLQKMNTSDNFMKQPNWLYFYFSAAADVNANPYMLNGSAFYFDTNCHYPNWYVTVPFNRTLSLFGPKAFRWDDFKDQDNYLREPTRQVVQVVDIGAGKSSNYTHTAYKMNPWYRTWLPDLTSELDSATKYTYFLGIKRSHKTGQFTKNTFENYNFMGPAQPTASETDERKLPAIFTQPYFDCGGSNKWVVSAVSPVGDFMPRYSNFTHMRRQRFVGVVVMDTDFIKLDFNACGVSPGNPGPSYLSGIARCRPTTGCKHKMGYGFKRGGYVCVCKSGWRYPWWLDPPYQGDNLEIASEEEQQNSFQCTPTDFRQVLPVIDQLSGTKVEGSAIVVNSGGLPLDITPEERSKRDASNNMYIENKYKGPLTMKANMSRISDLYLGIEVNNKNYYFERHEPTQYILREDLKISSKKKLRETIDTDYASKNDVDFSVEREYEVDKTEHEAFKRFLVDAGLTRNLTYTENVLKDNIMKIRDRHMERFNQRKNSFRRLGRHKRAAVFDQPSFDRMMKIVRQKNNVTTATCHKFPKHLLELPGDVGYGVRKQFESEGRTALRLTQFLSMYLQNVMPEENFGNLRGGGRLHEDMMYGEVLANVMGNFKIYSSGLFFDRYKWENQDGSKKEFFGPWAYRIKNNYFVVDKAGDSTYYTDEDWFRRAKAKFATNFNSLKRYKIRAYVRSNPNGTASIRHEYFPLIYYAAPYSTGEWTRPHFKCDGSVNAWVMTYITPFFGLDNLRTQLEFRGVVTVDVPLNLIEINQCPQPFTVANAFKNTARCDYFSTRCVPQAGFPFMRGSYRCLCRLGFEYMHADGKFWIEGSLVELEYEKKKAGIFSRFDDLRCRPSSVYKQSYSFGLLVLSIFLTYVTCL